MMLVPFMSDLTHTSCLFIHQSLCSWWFSLHTLAFGEQERIFLGHNSANCLVSHSFLHFKVNKGGIPTGKKAPFLKVLPN